MNNSWEEICLACGIVTTKQKRRLLSNLAKEDCFKSTVLLLKRLYINELAKRKKMLDVDQLIALTSDAYDTSELRNGFICLNCSKIFNTFCIKEEYLSANVAKALDILPLDESEISMQIDRTHGISGELISQNDAVPNGLQINDSILHHTPCVQTNPTRHEDPFQQNDTLRSEDSFI